MIRQLRPFYSDEELSEVYHSQYDHSRWQDHRERVAETTRWLDDYASAHGLASVADLSCGDGAIVNDSGHPWARKYLGDLIGPWELQGRIENTIKTIPIVDMFVCSETLEHVEDPAGLLVLIAEKANHLLLTTPHDEQGDENHEHYWGWDKDGIRELLEDAGWQPSASALWTAQAADYYTFQFWLASHE